jgi:phosphatidylinositol glycan class N
VSFFRREILALVFVGLAFVWPWFMPRAMRQNHVQLLMAWCLACVLNSIFLFLSVELREDPFLCNMGALSVLVLGMFVAVHLTFGSHHGIPKSPPIDIWFLWVMCLLAGILVNYTTWAIQSGSGVPLGNQLAAWALVIVSLATPFTFTSRHSFFYLNRLAVIFMTLACPMILLTTSYETLFYCSFAMTLTLWLFVEDRIHSLSDRAHQHTELQDQDFSKKYTVDSDRPNLTTQPTPTTRTPSSSYSSSMSPFSVPATSHPSPPSI